MKPKNIGGVEIYAPIKNQKEIKQADGGTLFEVTVDNGSKDGIRVEYKEQQGRKVDGQALPPVIYFDEKSKEVALRNLDNATIFGSEADDKVVSSCTNSVFKFKNGGSDIIRSYPITDSVKTSNEIYIDSSDVYEETFLYNNDEIEKVKYRYSGNDDDNSSLNFIDGACWKRSD